MSISVKESYAAVLANKNWKSKVYICGLFSCLGAFLIELAKNTNALFIIFALVTNFVLLTIVAGYFINAIRNSFHNYNDFIPDLKADFKKNLFIGFKFVVGIALLYLLLFGPITVFLSLPTLTVMFGMGSMVILMLFTLFIIVFSIFLLPALIIYYSTNLKFRSLFNFKQAFQIIKHGEYPKSSLKKEHAFSKLLICSIIIRIFASILEVVLAITIVGFIVIPFIEGLVLFMTAYLLAQVYQSAINDFKNNEPTAQIQAESTI